MSFKRGDVFLVTDTLYGGVVGSWQATRIVRTSPHDAKKGIIPNLSRYGCVACQFVVVQILLKFVCNMSLILYRKVAVTLLNSLSVITKYMLPSYRASYV